MPAPDSAKLTEEELNGVEAIELEWRGDKYWSSARPCADTAADKAWNARGAADAAWLREKAQTHWEWALILLADELEALEARHAE